MQQQPASRAAQAQITSYAHLHLPCQVTMRRRSAKYLNTSNFQNISNFSRLRIKEKCLRMDAASSVRHALSGASGAHLDRAAGNLMDPENLQPLHACVVGDRRVDIWSAVAACRL
jgi:hypothetical protein